MTKRMVLRRERRTVEIKDTENGLEKEDEMQGRIDLLRGRGRVVSKDRIWTRERGRITEVNKDREKLLKKQRSK